MLRLANLTTKEITHSGNYEISAPLLPISLNSPLSRKYHTQESIKREVTALIDSLEGYDGILLASLPDVAIYVYEAAKTRGIPLYMPVFPKHSRKLLDVIRIK